MFCFFAPEGFLYDDVIKTTLLQVVLFLNKSLNLWLFTFLKILTVINLSRK